MPMEYTFVNNYSGLRINENSLSNAVRVKLTVKDKIGRIYDKSNNGLESLIDNSDAALEALNTKLSACHNQKNVPTTVKRVVLFTKPLVEKISRERDEWMKFDETDKIDQVVAEPISITVDKKEDIFIPADWYKITNTDEDLNPVVSPVITQINEKPINDGMMAVKPEFDNSMSIEDKISELLNRNDISNEELVAEPNLLADNHNIEASENPNEIVEKVQKINDSMKEMDSENSDLKNQIVELQEKNNQLIIDSTKTEMELRAKVANLEGQIVFLKQSHTDKRNEINETLLRLKEKHAAEIEAVRAAKDVEYKEVIAKKDKQINLIYKTLSDALGQANMYDDPNKSLSA